MAAAQSVNQLSQNTQMTGSHPHAGIARVNAPNQMPMNGQGRPRMPMHAAPNGAAVMNHMASGLVPPMQMNGTSQVQMPTVNGQPRMAMPAAQPDARLLLQAQQISEQQRRSVQMRQQQQQQQQSHQASQANMPLQNSPPPMRAAVMNGVNQKNFLNNAQAQAMIASFDPGNGSGISTPPASTLSMTPQVGSPRPNATIPQPTHHLQAQPSATRHTQRSRPPLTEIRAGHAVAERPRAAREERASDGPRRDDCARDEPCAHAALRSHKHLRALHLVPHARERAHRVPHRAGEEHAEADAHGVARALREWRAGGGRRRGHFLLGAGVARMGWVVARGGKSAGLMSALA